MVGCVCVWGGRGFTVYNWDGLAGRCRVHVSGLGMWVGEEDVMGDFMATCCSCRQNTCYGSHKITDLISYEIRPSLTVF